MSLSAPAPAPLHCPEPPANCQIPDQLAHGSGNVLGATSDVDAGLAVAENFVPDVGAGGPVDSLCWWGSYVDLDANADCGPDADPPGQTVDHFTIRFYRNQSDCPTGRPGALILTVDQDAGQFLTFTRTATGSLISTFREYEYVATFNGPPVDEGECTWVAIQNDTSVETPGACFWLWETAGPGDNDSHQFGAPGPENDFDLALCIDRPFGDLFRCTAAVDPVPLCIGGTGECHEPNGTPGCNDLCCCSLVCEELPLCCLVEWTEACAAAAQLVCPYCHLDEECDDGDPCNGQELCIDSACSTLPPEPDVNGNGVLDDCECFCDCQPAPNGSVDIVDFLSLLGAWGDEDAPCDFDGGGVGVTDFLILLANWGPCN